MFHYFNFINELLQILVHFIFRKRVIFNCIVLLAKHLLRTQLWSIVKQIKCIFLLFKNSSTAQYNLV